DVVPGVDVPLGLEPELGIHVADPGERLAPANGARLDGVVRVDVLDLVIDEVARRVAFGPRVVDRAHDLHVRGRHRAQYPAAPSSARIRSRSPSTFSVRRSMSRTRSQRSTSSRSSAPYARR